MLKFRFFLTILTVVFFVGCGVVVPTPEQRVQNAKILTNGSKFKSEIFNASKFKIFSYHKELKSCKKAYIYIEGDGFAWRTSSQISLNPTPINPFSLKLALRDTHNCVVYLARPCQYIYNSNCNFKYWTSHRFSIEVIQSYQKILDRFKNRYKIDSFNLYGYSGGGAIATLLSAFRDDVDLLVTIAGNLDTKHWCNIHHLTPLKNSLNPADFTDRLKTQKQLHLIGEYDKNIDRSVFFSYYKKFKNKQNVKYKIFKGYTH